MSKDDSEIVRLAGQHVFDLFRNANGTSSLVYHGFKRSRALVDDCKEIAKGNKLNGSEGQVLMLSAWFHDAGFAVNGGGREKSIEIARARLNDLATGGDTHLAVDRTGALGSGRPHVAVDSRPP